MLKPTLAALSLLVLASASPAQKPKLVTTKKSGHQWSTSATLPTWSHPTALQTFVARTLEKQSNGDVASFKKQADGTTHDPNETDYSYSSEPTFTYTSKDVISGYTYFDTYTGGMHDSQGYQAWIFAMKDGKPVQLRAHDIFVNKIVAKQIAHKFVAVPIVARRGKDTMGVFSDEVPESDLGNIALTPKGIMWVIPPYDMDSFAQGVLMQTAPWNGLASAIKWTGPMKQFQSLSKKKR